MTGNYLEEHDVVFAEVPFVENNGSKFRPALVLSLDGEQIKVFKITTKYEGKSKAIRSRYFEIIDFAYAGLQRQSWIDTINIIPLRRGVKIRISGRLSSRDELRLREFLSNIDAVL